jgi:DNA-binding NtrC family response regulator
MRLRTRETIVVCGPQTSHTEGVVTLLGEEGWDVTRCTGEEALIAIICEHRPRAIVYALAHQIAVDLALLALLRQVAPDLPVVVVAYAGHGFAAGRLDAVHPVVLEQSQADRLRLRHALRSALRRPRQRAPRLAEAAG